MKTTKILTALLLVALVLSLAACSKPQANGGNMATEDNAANAIDDLLAEGPIKQHAEHNHHQQNAELPRKQAAQCRTDAGIGKRQRNCPLQHALRAEILAEEGIPHAHIVYKERREQEYHHQQNSIFQVSQGLELPCRQLS